MKKHILSTLNKTWIFDLDGTIVKHNGYIDDGIDSFLPGAKEFLDNISQNDMIIIITSRKAEFKKQTIDFLENSGIRYNSIIFNAPYGERILINDDKPSGLKMSHTVNLKRNVFFQDEFIYDEKL